MVTAYEQDQFTSVATLPATPLTCAGKICFAHPQAIVNIDTTLSGYFQSIDKYPIWYKSTTLHMLLVWAIVFTKYPHFSINKNISGPH